MAEMMRSVVFRASVLVLGLLAACAGGGPDVGGFKYQPSDQARAAYYFLLLEEARRTPNATVADTAISNLLVLDPSPRIFLETGDYYWRRGRTDRARAILEQGRGIHPGELPLTLLLADTYLSEEQPDEAARILGEYVNGFSENKDAVRALGGVLIQNGRFAEALDILKGIPGKERSPTVQYYIAKALAGLGSNAQAIEQLHTLLAKEPGFVEAWADLAYLQESVKDFVSAEQTYFRMLELGETSEEVWLRLIELNLKLNDPDKALSLVRQGPDTLGFQLQAASTFLEQKFFSQAEQILTPLAPRGEASPEIYFYLAVLAFDGKKDFDSALEYMKRIPESNPYHSRSLRFQSHFLLEMGQVPEALNLAMEGRRRFPGERDFWVIEARLRDELGESEKALGLLKEAQSLWVDDTEILYLTGLILDRIGQHEESFQLMETVISLDPEHADALNYVGYSLADQRRNLDRAYVLVRTALNQKPDSGYIIDSLAWVYFRLGKFREAWEEVRRAVDKVSGDPTIWSHYGDIAAAMGKKDAARKGYTRSLELGGKGKDAVRKKLDAL
jgi:tetratricopeptide (TPR) repeat protein